LSLGVAQLLFWLYAALVGPSGIFLVYTGQSVARVFVIGAAAFATMSVYGYATARDLSHFGSLLIMGLIGILIAYVVNYFLHSTPLQRTISVIGVFVFVGLTAFDTQRIKALYVEGEDGTLAGKNRSSARSRHAVPNRPRPAPPPVSATSPQPNVRARPSTTPKLSKPRRHRRALSEIRPCSCPRTHHWRSYEFTTAQRAVAIDPSDVPGLLNTGLFRRE
jgi:hypothetical protein